MGSYFGVGCFQFGLRRGGDLEKLEYQNELRTFLESFASVDAVEFTGHDGWSSYSTMPAAGHHIEKHRGAFPCLPGALKFSITIPNRIQRELLQFRLGNPRTLTERFDVVLTYPSMPVAFVWPVEPTGTPSPSDAV